MKKITTLFKKDITNLNLVTSDIAPENQWVFDGEAIATRKFDGTSVAIINGQMYKRYDAKLKPNNVFQVGDKVSNKNHTPFKNGEFIDEIFEFAINNERVSAILSNNNITVPLYKLKIIGKFLDEYAKQPPVGAIPCQEPDMITGHHPHWVLCSEEENADKYFFEAFDVLKQSGNIIDGTYELIGEKIQGNPEKITGHRLIKHGSEILNLEEISYEYLKNYLSNPENDIEGIVFHHKTDGRMCKLRKKDFNIKRK